MYKLLGFQRYQKKYSWHGGGGGGENRDIIVFPPTQFLKNTKITITHINNGIMDRAQYAISQHAWCVTNSIQHIHM